MAGCQGLAVLTHVKCWELEPPQCLPCHSGTVRYDSISRPRGLQVKPGNHEHFLLLLGTKQFLGANMAVSAWNH